MLKETWKEIFFIEKIIFVVGIVMLGAMAVIGVVGYIIFGWPMLLLFLFLFLSLALAIYKTILHPALKRARRMRALKRKAMGLPPHKIG